MKRYLIRTAIDPFKHYSPKELANNDFIMTNSGNLVFQYSVMNVLYKEEVELEPITNYDITSDHDIDIINSKFDACIFPFADAFRESFKNGLARYAIFFEKVKIPCHIIGIGLNAEYDPDFEKTRIFDRQVKDFVSGVLKHTNTIGLRGELTAEYLKTLGFRPEKDFTVIGCPSMYMHGTAINTREIKYDAIEKIAYNINIRCNDRVKDFIQESMVSLGSGDLVQQRTAEFFDMYYNTNLSKQITNIDRLIYNKLKRENRIRFFYNVPDWLLYMEKRDLLIGCRIHGTVAAMLGGVPCIFVPIDSRTRELAEYHSITTVEEAKLKVEDISSYISKIDREKFKKRHAENLSNYIDFLHKNDIGTILDEKTDWPIGTSPMERIIYSSYEGGVDESYLSVGAFEKLRRKAEAVKPIAEIAGRVIKHKLKRG